jgi:hypothetical protein
MYAVDLEQLPVIPLGVVGLDTLWHVSIVPKEVRIVSVERYEVDLQPEPLVSYQSMYSLGTTMNPRRVKKA